MKAPVLHGRRSMRYEEVPDPAPGEGEVVVEVGLCGICGSDLHLYDSDMAPEGIVLGHEYGGTIVEVGKGVTGWEAGDRVVGAPMKPCMNCAFCLRGEFDFCYQHFRLDMARAGTAPAGGASLGAGGYGPYTKITAPRLMRVPDGLDERQAASVEPAAVGFHAVKLSGMKIGDRVAILGAGPIGLFTLQCALAAGARAVTVAEPAAGRGAIASKLGAGTVLNPRELADVPTAIADTLGGPPDVVFDAAGVAPTLQQAVDIVRPGGSVMMVGVAFDNAPVKPSVWVTKRVTVRAAFAYSRADYEATIAMLERGTIRIDPVVTTVVGASETHAAFERLLTPNEEVKVLVDPRR
ncbi:MAG: alcohol dehydrogenase catalytic domain-containing protein [Dehalococcoidia bacterium]|nr:alcohol dehydrogenase catalytic domain-containing protein [Dehalococcoidia bacterium]